MSRFNSFLGPWAPWMEGEEDEYVYSQVKSQAAQTLVKRLAERIAVLQSDGLDLSTLLHEIRRQTATSGVDGDFALASDLVDLAMDLHLAHENSRRAV